MNSYKIIEVALMRGADPEGAVVSVDFHPMTKDMFDMDTAGCLVNDIGRATAALMGITEDELWNAVAEARKKPPAKFLPLRASKN